jgi:hypothetical protein
MEAGMAENDINTCYLAGSNTTGYPNVMKTTDGGNSWTHVFSAQGNVNINTGWCGSSGDRDWGYAEVFFGLSVARNDASKVITPIRFVHKTSDGGIHAASICEQCRSKSFRSFTPRVTANMALVGQILRAGRYSG